MERLQINKPNVSFNIDVGCEREKSLGHVLEEWGFFIFFTLIQTFLLTVSLGQWP